MKLMPLALSLDTSFNAASSLPYPYVNDTYPLEDGSLWVSGYWRHVPFTPPI
jgi:hypothetical protein